MVLRVSTRPSENTLEAVSEAAKGIQLTEQAKQEIAGAVEVHLQWRGIAAPVSWGDRTRHLQALKQVRTAATRLDSALNNATDITQQIISEHLEDQGFDVTAANGMIEALMTLPEPEARQGRPPSQVNALARDLDENFRPEEASRNAFAAFLADLFTRTGIADYSTRADIQKIENALR